MTTTQAEWNDLLVDAGGRPCSRCGKQAMVRAQRCDATTTDADSGHVAHDVPVWFCFECGHEERLSN